MIKLLAKPFRLPIMVAVLVAVGIASLLFYRHFRTVAFPEHAIQLTVTREEAAARSTDFLQAVLGQDASGYTATTAWVYDGDRKTFLEQELGVERTTALGDDALLWGFLTRYVRPSQSEQFLVHVAPDGRVLAYLHRIDDDAPGARVTIDEALQIAEAARHEIGPRTGTWRLLNIVPIKRPERHDWVFTWERTDLQWPATGPDGHEAGRLLLDVVVHGDRAGIVRPYLSVPARWTRDYQQIVQTKAMIKWISWLLASLPLTLVALIVCVRHLVRRDLQWRTAATLASMAGILAAVDVVNRLPVVLLDYDPMLSWVTFGASTLKPAVYFMFAIALFGAAGEAWYRAYLPRHLTLKASFSWDGAMTQCGAIALGIGSLLGMVNAAYQTIYYLVGAQIGFWVPADAKYDKVQNAFVPWLQPAPDGYLGAFSEDFVFRLFAIPLLSLLLMRALGRARTARWLAIIVSAFFWGLSHGLYAHEPIYARPLETWLVGICMGWLMVRFGIVAPIAAHFTLNALHTATALDAAGSPGISLLAYGIAAVPVMLAVAAVIRARLRGSFVPEAGLLNRDLSSRLAGSSTRNQRQWPRLSSPRRYANLAWERHAAR